MDLSLPRFGRDLLLNQGIAYLQYAHQFADSVSFSSLDEQAIFIQQALRTFDQAQQLGCQIQKMEQTTATACQTDGLIDQWTQQAHLQLQKVYQKKREEWSKQSTNETLVEIENLDFQKAYVNYELLFLQEIIGVDDLEKLIAQLKGLQGNKKQSSLFKQIQENLQTSLEELKSHHQLQARFFLLTGFTLLDSLVKETKKLLLPF